MSVASFFLCPFGFHLTSKMPLARSFQGFSASLGHLKSWAVQWNDPWVQHLEYLVGQKMEMLCNRSMATWSWKSHHLSRFMLIRKFQGVKKLLLLSAFNAILVLFSMQTTWPRMNLCFHSVMMLMLLMLVCEEGCEGRQVQARYVEI